MKQKSKTSSKITKRIFNFIAETGSAMFMKRSHQRSLLTTFDTVASHNYHVAIIAYVICRMEGLSHDDGLKAIAFGVIHDIPETRTGDLDFVMKHYGKNDEELAIDHQLDGLPFAEDLKKLYTEYIQRDSLVAKCTKDADIVDQIYQEWVMMHTGNKLAQRWFEGSTKNRVPFLRTESAKVLINEMQMSHPHEWWWQNFVDNSINQEFLTGKNSYLNRSRICWHFL